MDTHDKSRIVSIVLDEDVRTLNITFSNSRTSKKKFNNTVEKIIRLGVQAGHDPRYDTICLKSTSPRTFKYMGDYLAAKFTEFRKKLAEAKGEKNKENEAVEVKCLFNEIEIMKFHFKVDSASFQW